MVAKNRGFTVVELLIGVGIIAIMIGIIIPALYTVKNKAQQIVCANNMRQLFFAFEQYANDNNGLLPRTNNSNTSKDSSRNCNAEVWFKAVDNYLTSLQLPVKRDEISPEERLLLVKQDPIFKTVPLSEQDNTRTIKMNQNLVPASDCQRYIETIENPTKTVLLFDGNIYNSSGNYSSAVANKFEGSYGSVAQRHSKAANILFIDGHVERIQNGDSDGTTNEGWPNRQAGQGLIWDPDNPNLP
ncbi:MAG: prepilin-type N-terminal cleavage/methylation domain-containing protein [Candidatus Brocadia sp.]